MDNKGAAYHRKEQILNDSVTRLKNLMKDETDTDDTNSKPSLFNVEGFNNIPPHKIPSCEYERMGAPPMVEIDLVDPNKVRLVGYLQIHLYLFALLFGAFVCYYRHHEALTGYYPRFLHNFFVLLKRRGAHRLSDRFFKLWNKVPVVHKKKLVKYMSYGTVGVSLYPVLTAPKKPKGPESPQEAKKRVAREKLNQKFISMATSVMRVLAATMFCGLLGYDLAYNWEFFKKLLFKK